MKNKKNFTVLEGGLSHPEEKPEKSYRPSGTLYMDRSALEFQHAWITDTRLMGVVCLGISWRIIAGTHDEFLQYFYFDAVEYGFDRFDYLMDPGDEEKQDLEASYIGGLGGSKLAVSEREAVHLVHQYTDFNHRKQISLPDGQPMYQFILLTKDNLTRMESRLLLEKSCIKPRSRVEAVNYFLMRYTDRDWDAVSVLTDGDISHDLLSEYGHMGVFSNHTEDSREDPNALDCRTIVSESDDSEVFYLLMSTFKFKGLSRKISEFIVRDKMEISDQEAYLNLLHKEYVMVFDYTGPLESFGRQSSRLLKRAMIVQEDEGTTYMLYRPNNDHALKSDFHLYDDLIGIYYMGNIRQLVISSNTPMDAKTLEFDLLTSPVAKYLKLKENLLFSEPVMNNFLMSGMADFEDFLDLIRE
ncbi:MAG: hypothetical protein LKG42_02400 [Eubacterium sp.]|jgi:hypothetical protein|nr:hypothetical protein [Eubacterium sp.]MCH4047128.1 hypothetical protein [Eubacterium sp.]MCH4080225.1 hypothetical protein [Eubacterium sp.]MCH4111174.1 hypothetical protein [Eubacterium sp.]MCI1306856.1 hypothetical protein [Eubacterium sp.]